jgi:ribonucleoside-diphosphate reductase alpha chain
MFRDNANKNKPECYKDSPIHASNMCVAPETKILTDNGYIAISSLEDKEVNVWNGEEFTATTVRKTGENQELMKVVFNTGQVIECTPYHKFYLHGGAEVRASELKAGHKMIKFNLPVIEAGANSLDCPYDQGFFSGDGCRVGNNNRIYLYGEKKKLLRYMSPKSSLTVQEEQDRVYFNSYADKPKDFVPTGSYNHHEKLAWLAGLFDSDGCTLNNKGSMQVQVGSINLEFLRNVQLLLQELGCLSSISKVRDEGMRLLPANDGSGELKEYDCAIFYRLNISTSAVSTLLALGLNTHRLDFSDFKEPNRNASRFITVERVEYTGRIDDTYCFTEPSRNMGMFNGVLTGNCSEIMLPSNKDETFVCVLSSMNLVKYDEWKNTDAVEILTYFLDSVVSEFVEKIRYNPTKYRFMERAATFAHNHRALGLGVLGWHHLLQSKMIPFESRDAAKLNLEVFKFINQKANEASKKAAEEFGECRMTEGTGRRNATLMAIAPTKSSSFLLGQVSQSIEPEFSNCYIKDLAKAKVTVKNPYLTKLLQEKGKDTSDVWDTIIKNDGSVQHLSFLSDDEKAVFRTFAEISPEAIINQAAVRQTYIDQGQSLNLMIDPKTPVKDINKLYLDAWKLGVKSLYYQYSINASQALTRKKLATEGCASCEG